MTGPKIDRKILNNLVLVGTENVEDYHLILISAHRVDKISTKYAR